MDSTHTGQCYIMIFSGSRRGLAGPLETLTGQFLLVRNPQSLVDFEQITPNPFEQIMVVLHLHWFLPFSIHQHKNIETCRPKSFGSLRVLQHIRFVECCCALGITHIETTKTCPTTILLSLDPRRVDNQTLFWHIRVDVIFPMLRQHIRVDE